MLSVLLLPMVFFPCEASLLGLLRNIFNSGAYGSLKETRDWLYPDFYDDNEIIPRTYDVVNFDNGTKLYKLLVVTDMDNDAKTVTNWTWRAVTRKGSLKLSKDKKNVTITWNKDSDRNLTTHLNVKGRAMELSDLSEFNGRLLSPDDKTGMIYEIHGGKAIPWIFLNSGPGNTTDGMKAEWTTIKGDFLYVGGHGTEYRNKTGAILNKDAMWIKIINKKGEVKSVNWESIYKRIRAAVNISEPGYLTHEAVQWSQYHQKWFFLPRKESQTIYKKTEDEMKGSNLLLIGDRFLEKFEIVRIGNITDSGRGFSAFDFLPGMDDQIIVALKSKEVHGSPTESYVTVFDIKGHILLEDQKLEDHLKFEGIYFV
ncbi:Apyrase [Dictyocaulus viviparus]|uniref:Apyrase n=1 Tax=Dictyocaulus viviparus TaxID=29172 RepID=A0A0D8XA52_DICVI|nr:Apyrase [Dictyocaulus viviparus]